MSDLTPTEPELLPPHIDVAYASSIERIATGRNAALAEIADLIRHLAAISELTASIGGGTFNDWGERTSHRHGCWLMADG
ncbi:hypothetical protein ACOY5X_11860 [Enterobacter kobei]|uniref:hypothetical protein n=1 Tax=Enterobacter kobei TaxID=208224 RepID=UPI003BEEF0E1